MATRVDRRTAVGRPLHTSPRWDRRALACSVLAATLLAAALLIGLSHGRPHRSGTNGVWVQGQVPIPVGSAACQRRELLPANTIAVRFPGVARQPPIVTVRYRGRLLARATGTVDARREVIDAAIPRTTRDRSGVEVCLRATGRTALFGGPTPPRVGALAIDGGALEASMAIDYLAPGHRSWWASATTVVGRVCRGHGQHAPCGTAWAIVVLMAASLTLTGVVVVRSLVADRATVRTALAVAAVAALNAAAWSLITPPFQVPDEVAHVAYVQSIGETGSPPAAPRGIVVSPEQAAVMADSRFGSMFAATLHTAAWAPSQQRALAADGRRPLSRRATISQGEGEPEPPVYYALEALPYRVLHGSSLLGRMTAMRLLSAMLAGMTALLSFLFVRECLPSRRWAWTVGGLGVALAPMLGFISGGVNPDALLYTLSAGLFLTVARAWSRGVTPRLVALAGALIAVGMLTKVNYYGLVPGALLGLALAARRWEGAWNRRVALRIGAVIGLAGVLFLAVVGFEQAVWHRPFAVGRPASPESHVGLWAHVNYIWQVFLPRLPFQTPTTLTAPGYDQLFRSFVGAFGWMVVWLPAWAYRLALAAALAIGAFAVRMLLAEPRELRWRRGELFGYVAMAGVLLLMIGISVDVRRDILHIVQGRYLLPLLPLFGLVLALAARGAGERWGRAAGVVIIAGAVAWTVLGQLLTLAFFYS